MSKQRHPRELLERIAAHARADAEDWIMPPAWNYAAAHVEGYIGALAERQTPPLLRPRPSYYGAKGSLRNPHR